MVFFYQEEPPNSSKKCKFLSPYLKQVISDCCICGRQQVLAPKMEKENLCSNSDDEQEVVISEIRSRAMEAKAKQKHSFRMDSLRWVLSPTREELFMIPKPLRTSENCHQNHEQTEDFFSASSSFSHCSIATTIENYLSVKTNLSSINDLECCNELFRNFLGQEFWWGLDAEDLHRRSIILEVCQCEGWPFGLCRKALLLPPLPKSPSDSWSWRKRS